MDAQACNYVIFGATGNLSRIKLMPAFYHLDVAGELPEGTKIVAIGRREWTQEKWLAEVKEMIQTKIKDVFDEAIFEKFAARLHYHFGDLGKPECYSTLATTLEQPQFSNNTAFYLSIAPADFGNVMEQLSKNKLFDEQFGWKRVVIEKPFGYDLDSAKALQNRILKVLELAIEAVITTVRAQCAICYKVIYCNY
jgi:glucose-6-phosphate 1-dehydrogenase